MVSEQENRYEICSLSCILADWPGRNRHSDRLQAAGWHKTGRQVKAIVDNRLDPSGSLVRQAKTMGIKLIFGAAVYEARGKGRVHSALIGKLQYGDGLKIKPLCEVSCDTIGTSGGSSPVIHLACHTGLRPKWDDDVLSLIHI